MPLFFFHSSPTLRFNFAGFGPGETVEFSQVAVVRKPNRSMAAWRWLDDGVASNVVLVVVSLIFPWLLRVYVGDEKLPSYMGITIIHY